jgi:hypothetical protein
MLCQDPIDDTDAFVTNGHQGTLSCAFAGGVGLSAFVIALKVGRMRDEPQGIVIEPVPQIGAASV